MNGQRLGIARSSALNDGDSVFLQGMRKNFKQFFGSVARIFVQFHDVPGDGTHFIRSFRTEPERARMIDDDVSQRFPRAARSFPDFRAG